MGLYSRELVIFVAVAFVIGGLMIVAHGEHYRRRKFQMLDGRVATLERIVAGEHS